MKSYSLRSQIVTLNTVYICLIYRLLYKAFALTGRVFKIYIIFRHVFCVKIQVKSHEINVL